MVTTQNIVLEDKNYTFYYDVDWNLFAILIDGKNSKWLYKFIINKFDYRDCYLYDVKNELNTKLVDYLLIYEYGN